jgi:hypothetical protein
MDQEERELLENTFSLAKENNQMLHKIRRSQKIADLMRFLYWLVILGAAVGAFYFIQPYIEQIESFIGNAGVTINNFKGILPK